MLNRRDWSASSSSSMRLGLLPRDLCLPGLPVREELRDDAAEPRDFTTEVATPRSLAYISLWVDADDTTDAVSCA